jgi:hypothetical protein
MHIRQELRLPTPLLGAALTSLLLIGAPALAADEPVLVKPAGKELKLTLGGLVQAQGEFMDAGDARFPKDNRSCCAAPGSTARAPLPRVLTSASNWTWAARTRPCAAR